MSHALTVCSNSLFESLGVLHRRLLPAKESNKSTIKYTYIGGFTLTQEDAKAYLCADSTKRRVHKWKDVKVNVFI